MGQKGNEDDVTVVRKACGHIVLAVVTKHIDSSTKLEIGDLIVEGATVEHMPAPQFRAQDYGCGCAPEADPA